MGVPKNVFAFTEPGPLSPRYISVNRFNGGAISICVRGQVDCTGAAPCAALEIEDDLALDLGVALVKAALERLRKAG
jgi:hypothetical protein